MTLKNIFFAMWVMTILSGCAIQVKTRYDQKADFDKYKTFCWMQGCEFKIDGPSYLNDSLLREYIKNSIIKELTSKGLSLDDNNPDLLVGFTIAVKNEQVILFQHDQDTPSYQQLDIEAKVVNYLDGTMIIALADKQESKVVWVSTANRYMELHPDLSAKSISKGIHLVLKKFPPGK